VSVSVQSHIWSDLQNLVGPAYVKGDSIPHVEPANESEVASVLSYANDNHLRVTPLGSGTKTSWGNAVTETGLVLSTSRLNNVLEYQWEDLTVTVQAGCKIAILQHALAERGQRVAFDPLWPAIATVGGVLSTNDNGALRLGFGGLRDLIIGVTLCLSDGTIAKSGGKVVKNVAGYDLPKLATGALGTLGVITQAIFRLHPRPQEAKTLAVILTNRSALKKLMEALGSSKLTPVAVQIRVGSDGLEKMEILFEGTNAGVALQNERFRSLLNGASVQEAQSSVWKAREELWACAGECVIAKLSVMPSEIVDVSELVGALTGDDLQWQIVWYSTGIGWLRLDGASTRMQAVVSKLRASVERQDGSLVILRQPAGSLLDAWGDVGTARDLMWAVKQQFDPKGILNFGRFAAGI
jgi:glycolate oxidase FAD binding subunit